MSDKFILHGIWRSGPTYKVGLMLALSGQSFAYRHIDLRAGQHKTPEFLALNRYGQVPVLQHGALTMCQSGAILMYLAETLGKFGGKDAATRQRAREWVLWDADKLSPGIYRTRAVAIGIFNPEQAVKDMYKQAADLGLAELEKQLGKTQFLAGTEPTIADIACYGVCHLAPEGGFDLGQYPNLSAWMGRMRAVPGWGSNEAILPKENRD